MAKKEKSPAYQRYPKDYLTDLKVLAMTSAQEGAYNRLMDLYWLEGSLPNDEEKLRSFCKSDITIDDIRVVIKCFTPKNEGAIELVHARMEREREKQLNWSQKSSQGGKNGAKTRWKGKGGHQMVITKPQPNDDIAFPSPEGYKEDFFKGKEVLPLEKMQTFLSEIKSDHIWEEQQKRKFHINSSITAYEEVAELFELFLKRNFYEKNVPVKIDDIKHFKQAATKHYEIHVQKRDKKKIS